MGLRALQQELARLGRQYAQRMGTQRVLEGLQGAKENARQISATLLGGAGAAPGGEGQQNELQRLLVQMMRRQVSQMQAPEARRGQTEAAEQAEPQAEKNEEDLEKTRERARVAKEYDRQVQELAKSTAKLTLALGVTAPLALAGFVAAVLKASRAAREHARALAQVSPEMAAVDAANTIREIRRMQQSGRATAATTGFAASAWQDLQDTLRPIRDFFVNLKNLAVGTIIKGLVNILRAIFKALLEIADALTFGKARKFLETMEKINNAAAEARSVTGRDILRDVLEGRFGPGLVEPPGMP